MNRKHKFRGKRIDNGEWIYGYYFKDKEGNSLIKVIAKSFTNSECNEEVVLELDYEVIPETVGEYTGLKDNKRTKEFPNGQEIYENDIVQVTYAKNETIRIGKVIYGELAKYQLKGKNIHCQFSHIYNFDWDVIGNSYDNKELLEVN